VAEVAVSDCSGNAGMETPVAVGCAGVADGKTSAGSLGDGNVAAAVRLVIGARSRTWQPAT
jgi:hypothetical protein